MSLQSTTNIGYNLSSSEPQIKDLSIRYQYGNLRNIKSVSRYTGKVEACNDHYFQNPYQITDQEIGGDAKCKFTWKKAVISENY
jgi:hypothetical protein